MRQRGARRTRLLMVTVLMVIIVVAAILPILVEGRGTKTKHTSSQRRRKKFRAGVGKDFSEFFLVIGITMACVIAPVLVVFVHSIYKDPTVPGLAREIWKVLKRKLLSYLGQEASTTQENPSTFFLEGSDQSLASSLRRNGRRREPSSWIGDDDDVVYWASDEGTKRFAARTTRSSTILPEGLPSVHPKRVHTDYQPRLLHEYAPYARHALEEEWPARETSQESSLTRARAETTPPLSSNLHVERVSWRAPPPKPEEIKEGGLIPSESEVNTPPMLTSVGQAQRAANISNNNGGFETKGRLRWGCESLAGGQHAQHTTMTVHGDGMHEDTQSWEKLIRMKRSRGSVETFNRHGHGGAQGT